MNYGKVMYRHVSDASNDATYGGKILTGINFSYNITEQLNLSLRVNNLFNIYLDLFADAYIYKRGVLNDRNLDFVGRFKYPLQTTQFGIDGTRIFTKSAFSFKTPTLIYFK
jgi:iron complex outermembrane receptor protein